MRSQKAKYEIDDQVVGSEPKTKSMKKVPAAKKVASKKVASDVAKPVAKGKAKAKAVNNVVGIVQKAKAKTEGKAKSKAAAKTKPTKANQWTATKPDDENDKDHKKKAACRKSVKYVNKMPLEAAVDDQIVECDDVDSEAEVCDVSEAVAQTKPTKANHGTATKPGEEHGNNKKKEAARKNWLTYFKKRRLEEAVDDQIVEGEDTDAEAEVCDRSKILVSPTI